MLSAGVLDFGRPLPCPRTSSRKPCSPMPPRASCIGSSSSSPVRQPPHSHRHTEQSLWSSPDRSEPRAPGVRARRRALQRARAVVEDAQTDSQSRQAGAAVNIDARSNNGATAAVGEVRSDTSCPHRGYGRGNADASQSSSNDQPTLTVSKYPGACVLPIHLRRCRRSLRRCWRCAATRPDASRSMVQAPRRRRSMRQIRSSTRRACWTRQKVMSSFQLM